MQPPCISVFCTDSRPQNLKTLTRLELRGGCLITIPEGISALESLEVLDLSRWAGRVEHEARAQGLNSVMELFHGGG